MPLGILGVFALALAVALLWLLPTAPAHAQQDTTKPRITGGPTIASSPKSGDTYRKGETIRVTLTFSEAVTVEGQPRVRLVVGERKRWARHSSADGATLTFAYTVKKVDADPDGVSVPRNGLSLAGGSIADASDNAARRKHSALADQSGHKVNGSRKKPTTATTTTATTTQPASNSQPAFASATAERSVDENSAPGTNVGAAVIATDADSDTLTYALTGDDAGSFKIKKRTGQIKVKSALNYEAQDTFRYLRKPNRYLGKISYTVRVTVSDGKADDGSADSAVDDTIAVTIKVNNVEEPGTLTLDTETPRVGSKIRSIVAEPDLILRWSSHWHRSRDGTNWGSRFNINHPYYMPTAEDVGHYLRYTMIYWDRYGGYSPDQQRTLQVTTANPVATP